MKSRFQGMTALAAGAAASATMAFWACGAWANADRIGEPTPGAIDLQPEPECTVLECYPPGAV